MPSPRVAFWVFTDGTATGKKTLTAPPIVGSYHLVYFVNDGYDELYRSDPFIVGAASSMNADQYTNLGNVLAALQAALEALLKK